MVAIESKHNHICSLPGTLNSKPDSIYQLIRQVLDAKKKGQSSQQKQQMEADYHLRVAGGGLHPYGTLGANAMMNLSTGNLAMANHDGKSVSTSALGTTTAASVDRWAVVMDLLAQSRKKTHRENADGSDKGAIEGSSSLGKRHSKQLDKFKLAAKSAAAASKHQHYYLQQRQQQLSPTPPISGLHSDQAVQSQVEQGGSQSPQQRGNYQSQQYQVAPAMQQQQQQQHHHHNIMPQVAGELTGGFIGQMPLGRVVAPPGGVHGNAEQQTGPSMHLHQAKSLPVGQLAAVTGQQQLDSTQQHPGVHMGDVIQPGTSQQQPQQQQQQLPMPYQLLNIGAQQLQSTSGKSPKQLFKKPKATR